MKRGAWAVAEERLAASVVEAAKEGAKPGQTITTPVSRYRDSLTIRFIPDLYLVLVYANTNRQSGAVELLNRVRRSGWSYELELREFEQAVRFAASGDAVELRMRAFRRYKEGVDAAKRGDYAVAEQILTASVPEAAKAGVQPGQTFVFLPPTQPSLAAVIARPSRASADQAEAKFLPDLYLGLVYARTGRFDEAEDAIKRVRQNDWLRSDDRHDAGYLAAIALISKLTDTERKKVAVNTPLKPAATPPITESPPAAPKSSADTDAALRRNQFDGLMQRAQQSLANQRIVEAREAATSARELNVDNPSVDELLGRIEFEVLMDLASTQLTAKRYSEATSAAKKARDSGVSISRADALIGRIVVAERTDALAARMNDIESHLRDKRFEEARTRLKEASALGASSADVNSLTARIRVAEAEDSLRRAIDDNDVNSARVALKNLRSIDPSNVQLATFAQSIAAILSGDTQRLALIAFYRGDYRQTIRTLQPLAERADASPRVQLYLASSNAALVLLGNKDDATLLATAREQYRKARSSGTDLSQDLRLISPRILKALQGGRQ